MYKALEDILTVVGNIVKGAWRAIHQRSTLFLMITSSLLLVAVVGIGFVVWRLATPPQRVILLTGPRGGAGERLGRSLETHFGTPAFWNVTERRGELVARPTDGFEDNRRQIDQDSTGKLVGFAHDGFHLNPSGNMRILLPLEETYVHIIVSKTFYDAATGGARSRVRDALAQLGTPWGWPAEQPPRLLEHLVDALHPGSNGFEKYARRKVFVGPALSGTRQTARLILDHYDVPLPPLDCQRPYNWEEMAAALEESRLHLAFFITEPGSPVVQRLARIRDENGNGRFYLLGLGDAAGICQFRPYIFSRTFERHAYGGGRVSDFLPRPIDTIATRRVIVCSKAMPAADAFWLANRLREAIRTEVPTIRWETPVDVSTVSTELTYPLHPGAVYIKDSRPWHSYVPSAVWWSLGLLVVLALVKQLDRILTAPPRAGTAPGDSPVPPRETDPGAGPQGAATPLSGGPRRRTAGANGAHTDRPDAPELHAPLPADGVEAARSRADRHRMGEPADPDPETYYRLYHDVRQAVEELTPRDNGARTLSRKSCAERQRRHAELWYAVAQADSDGLISEDQRQRLAQALWQLELLLLQRSGAAKAGRSARPSTKAK